MSAQAEEVTNELYWFSQSGSSVSHMQPMIMLKEDHDDERCKACTWPDRNTDDAMFFLAIDLEQPGAVVL